MDIDHVARARQAWPVLVALARKRGEPLTYAQICAKLALHHRAAAHFLGVIQDYCARHKLPPLQALVVNSRTRLPGLGSTGSGRSEKSHRHALERIYGHEWPTKPPRFD